MTQKSWRPLFQVLPLCGALLSTVPARAEQPSPAEPHTPSTQHAFILAGGYSSVDATALLGYRLGLAGGVQLGLEVRHAPSRQGYIDGFAATGGSAQYGTLRALFPLAASGPLELGLGTSLGVRRLAANASAGPERTSLAFTSEVGPIAHLQLSPALTLRAGWLQVTHLQTAPSTSLDAMGQVLVLGAMAPVTDSLQLYADLETGGLFGYDGDGGKYLTRGTVGARLMLGGAARRWNTVF